MIDQDKWVTRVLVGGSVIGIVVGVTAMLVSGLFIPLVDIRGDCAKTGYYVISSTERIKCSVEKLEWGKEE